MLFTSLLCALASALACLASNAEAQGVAAPAPPSYAYATNGVLDNVQGRSGRKWKLLLNESNLGGKEVEIAEITIPAGTTVGSHAHGAVEILYVLSGIYEHEVNGKLYRLTPGMVGIVRPEDKVRHLVPRDGDARLLIIWAPAGEAARAFANAKGTTPAPVTPH
jgi:quercetin dioxygenase-like cupin family protein